MLNLIAPMRRFEEGRRGPHARPVRAAVAAPVAIRIAAGGIVPLPGAGAADRIVCRSGTVWVTREGDAADHILRAGNWFSLAGPGRSVVQALSDATIELT